MVQLERKIAFGFGTALIVQLLVTAAAWWNVSRFQSTQYWVEHSREVISLLEQSISDVLGMQASMRGFVITAGDEVLRPFEANAAHLDEALKQLHGLTSDNPSQQGKIARLEPLADRAREQMRERIAARRSRGLDAVAESAVYQQGERTVQEFRQAVRDVVNEERQLLDDRLQRNNQASRFTVFAIVGASVVAVCFVAAAGGLVHRDLAGRRRAEAAAKESFARIEDLYHNAPCGYHSLDTAGQFLDINDTALKWLGYQRSEVVGRKSFAEILTPESAALFAERFPVFRESGAVQNMEYDWQRKDGTVLPVLLNAMAIYDATGQFRASRATVFDVTLRKRAETERDRFFTISRDLLSISDFEGGFKRVNPAWEQTLGFSADELRARPQIEFVHPDDRERTRDELARVAAGAELLDFENRYRTKDGSYRWLRWNARAVAADRLIYASARDVTFRKEADARIESLNHALELRAKQLEAANHELESFSYSVSHDLRAPLRHIDGFANLLSKRASDSLDSESRRYVGTITKSAKQMGALIDDLLAFSRIGRTPVRREPVDNSKLVAAIIAEGQYDSMAKPIAWDVRPLPAVRADPAMLRQVWANLIDNAVKYSGKSAAPKIVVEGHEDHANTQCVFSISDNGVGFDMAYADKLFGVFQRLHAPSEFEGTGIGLANVRRIITRHGGRTWAESRIGEGATFYFSIPFLPSSPASSG